MASPTLTLSCKLSPISFSEISNWADDDHLEAFKCFQLSAHRMVHKAYSTKSLGVNAQHLQKIALTCLEVSKPDKQIARNFFEEFFIPHRFQNQETQGILTAYYEPVVAASKTKTGSFRFPLYRRPVDLVDIDDHNRPEHINKSFAFARQTSGSLTHFFDRAQIQAGALENKGLELYWLDDPVDVFFIHIQGSARLLLTDGTQARVSYVAKSGHPYTAIGKTLVDLGELRLAEVTMDSIRQWLSNNLDRRDEIFATNQSYIFFQKIDCCDSALGPVAAAGVGLTPGRSLAVDRHLHTFGTPVWVETNEPLASESKPFQRLMIAQDTGSAIIGSERGDLFVGSGAQAGTKAGKINHHADMVVFVPNISTRISSSKYPL